ncbi:ABC transporter substrate-binding protein [Halorubrum salsamenti]|uniref:ABC transporter substrate-binding protein n=1 Tax=Halorubrum salsamenti TaxID=2583990 RepID=UPI0011A04283|nr:ABC transporter substrate-binding protein [Halorubrum salsamenti]
MPEQGNSERNGDYLTRRKMIGTGAAGVGVMLAGCSGGGDGSDGSNGSDGSDGSDGSNGSDGSDGSDGEVTDNPMEALHGWTGGDGAEAAAEIVTMFEERYPDYEHQIEPVGGDANVNLNATVARRLANRNPPDAFAGWPGLNMAQYGGTLDSLTEIYEENGWEDVMVPKALEACQMNDEYRAVPLGSHRLNNLFYNVSVLEEAGVNPDDITDWDSFTTARQAIADETDYIPVTTTTIAPWTVLQYWAQIMLGTEGQEPYEAWLAGDGNKDALVRALEKTQDFVQTHTNEDRATLSFPEANDKLINGEAGFFTMGNWAAGMYRNAEDFEFEEDWGWLPFPGTEGMYVFHLDSFMFPQDGNAPVKARAFAELIGDPELQVRFNNLKGSIPLRTDIDDGELDDFLTMNVEHLNNNDQFPRTLAHGLACTPEELDACKDAMANNFSDPYDAEATADALLAVFE